MVGRTPHGAVASFIDPLQQVISLVVPGGRGVLTYYPRPLRPGNDHWLSFPQGLPARLAGVGLQFELIVEFRVEESGVGRNRYEIATTGYRYSILDQNGRELLAYHFHPSGVSWCVYPHLHVSGATGAFGGKAHLATGPMSLAAVIRMLIEDPAIPVISLRPDWPRILDAASSSTLLA